MNTFPEKDWKILRAARDEMLNLACERILQQAGSLLADRAGKEHERYLALWELMREEDKQIAFIFDDLKRSTAIFSLAALRDRGLMSDEIFARLSEATRQRVKRLLED